jgi:hypothetical protein
MTKSTGRGKGDPSTNQPIPTGSRQKWAWAVKKGGRWRVQCRKCGLSNAVYGSWTTAASAAWKNHKH